MPRVTGAQAGLRLATTAPLGDWVAALAWSPDGTSVAAGCADGRVVTLAIDGDPQDAHLHDAPVTSVAWSSAGTLASGGQDGAVIVDGHGVSAGRGWIERVAWRPDGGLLAAARGRRVEMLDRAGALAATSDDFPATVTCLGWHPRGVELAAGSYGGVRLLRGQDAGTTKTLAWQGSVLELAISPDGKRLAHGNQDASVHFWKLRRDTELEMWGYETKVRELSWRHDARYLATGGGRAVTIWDFAGRGPAGSRPLELEQHSERVSWLGFKPRSALLASTALDGLAILWRPGDDDLPLATVALDDAITVAAWAPDGERLALGGAGGTLAIADVTERPV